MKFRTGFVSNSSSASYIVNIRLSKEEFLEQIFNAHDFSFFCKEEVLSDINDRIKEMIKDIREKREKQEQEHFYNFYTEESLLKFLKKEWEFRNTIKKLEGKDLAEKVLEKHGITIKELHDDEIVINNHTVMHNDYSDVPELFKAIILYFIFDTDIKINCNRVDY